MRDVVGYRDAPSSNKANLVFSVAIIAERFIGVGRILKERWCLRQKKQVLRKEHESGTSRPKKL